MDRRTCGNRAGVATRGRAAFTLVELLVVIIIIAILAALAVPAVMQATVRAQNARIKTEIDMLHQAIMQYKNEYGSFPPAVDFDAAGNPGRVNKHIQRIFPRVPAAFLLNNLVAGQMAPVNALVGWLRGYSDDPTNPMGIVSGSGGGQSLPGVTKKKLFDFDEARVTALAAGAQFAPPNKPGSPYIYIDSANYANLPYLAASLGVAGAHFDPPKPLPTPPAGAPTAWYSTNVNFPSATTQKFANADTFQIICAGRDEKFGTDDDLSNFWPGTRKDYLDSLK